MDYGIAICNDCKTKKQMTGPWGGIYLCESCELKHPEFTKGVGSFPEPTFTLRAQDISAPALVQLWISLNPQITAEKKKSALDTLEAMKAWQVKKKPD